MKTDSDRTVSYGMVCGDGKTNTSTQHDHNSAVRPISIQKSIKRNIQSQDQDECKLRAEELTEDTNKHVKMAFSKELEPDLSSGSGGNDKDFRECIVNSLRPKNWSHIEKLKSQKIWLQEKLSSQTQIVKKTEKAALIQPKNAEDSKMSDDCDADGETADTLLIADEESNTSSLSELNNPNHFCEIKMSANNSVLHATCSSILDHKCLRLSQSLTDCPARLSDEDADLCELRVSNINKSLFTAIAGVDSSELKDSKTIIEKETAESCSYGEKNSNSMITIAKPGNDKSNQFWDNPEIRKYCDEAISGKYTKEKLLHKSFSDTHIQSREAFRQNMLMKQKLKCLLKRKTKNNFLEKMLMRNLKSNLSSLDPRRYKRKIKNKDDTREAETEKLIQTENQTSHCETSTTCIDDINSNRPKCPKEARTAKQHRRSEHGNVKKKLLKQQIQTLKMQKELAKMKAKILQKESLCKYLAALEGRCDTKKTELTENDNNYLKIPERYNDACSSKVTTDKKTSTTSKECVAKTTSLNQSVSEKLGGNNSKPCKEVKERDSVYTSSTLGTKELPVNTPKTSTNDASKEQNKPSLKLEKVEEKEKQVISQNSMPISCSISSKTNDLKSQSPTVSVQKNTNLKSGSRKFAKPCMIVGNNICPLAVYPKVTVSNVSCSGKEAFLVQNGPGQPVYALMSKVHNPTQIVPSGLLFVPNAVNQTLQTCKTNLQPIKSVVYPTERPSTQIGNVAVINTVPVPCALTPSMNAQVVKVLSPPSKSWLSTTCTNTLTSSNKYSILSNSTQEARNRGIVNNRRTGVENIDLVKSTTSKGRLVSPLNTTHPRTEKLSCHGKDIQNFLICETSWKSQNQVQGEIGQQRSVAYPLAFGNNAKKVSASSEGVKINSFQGTIQARKEEASLNRDVNVTCIANVPSSQNNPLLKEHPSCVTRKLDGVINTDSESNDSFDSVDLLHYEIHKGQNRNAVVSPKNNVNAKPETLHVRSGIAQTRTTSTDNKTPYNKSPNSNETEPVCRSSQLEPLAEKKKTDPQSLNAIDQNREGIKKYMKTKFIILKGDICDKWLEIKRKVGFAGLPDPSFVYYLLEAVEKSQKSGSGVFDEQPKLVTETDVNNNSTLTGYNKLNNHGVLVPVSQEILHVQVDNIVNVLNPNLKSQEVSNKKHILKRPAQKIVRLEAKESDPKKAKYDLLSGINHELVKERYNFLSESTKKQMTWAVTTFREWLKSQNVKDFNFEYQGTAWLNMMLENFYREAHSYDKKKYSADTLQNFRRSLSIYLEGHPQSNCVNISIPLDPGFGTSNQVLTDIMKNLDSLPPQDNLPINSEDFEKMYTSNTLSDRNPVSLLWKVWFDISYYLCTGQYPENFMNSLKKHDLALQSDVNGVFYTFTDDVCLPPEETQAKMYATPDVPERCPVRTTTVYLSQLCDDCDSLFQRPRALWKPGKKWYLPTPISLEKLSSMMKKISEAAKLSKVYKTSSVLATAQQAKNGQ